MWGESGESLAPLSSPSSPPSPSSEGRSSLSLSQQITFLTEQYCHSPLLTLKPNSRQDKQ
ncbi:MAG: hypothetical protein QNJ18_17650 [Xenococcaceae cyanobacterium MO_167.B52]|nr:hypothetical protein [Xenococcaceae cyanobacterium MO_167.B52]